MKKMVTLLALVVIAVSGFSQITGQTKRQIRMLNKEIDLSYVQVRQEIKSLNYYQRPKHYDSTAVESLQKSIRFNKKRVAMLLKKKNNLLNQMVDYSGTPVELSALSMKRRLRSLSVQERELFLRKVQMTVDSSTSTSATSLGYRGVVKNEYFQNLTVKFTSVRGGESKSVYLYSGQQLYLSLLPGTYSVNSQSGEITGNTPYRLVVPAPTGANFAGEKVSWYIVIPRY